MNKQLLQFFRGLRIFGEEVIRNPIGGMLASAAAHYVGGINFTDPLLAVSFASGSGLEVVATYYLGLLEPHIETMTTDSFPHCCGKTNNGQDVAILISDAYSNVDGVLNKIDAHLYAKQLERKRSFLGYPVGDVHIVSPARKRDATAALYDESISSIILIGHSCRGIWVASDGEVKWQDVAEDVKGAGHCKNGFGYNRGCDDVVIGPEDIYHVLAPAYGHTSHGGGLFSSYSNREMTRTYGLPTSKPKIKRFLASCSTST